MNPTDEQQSNQTPNFAPQTDQPTPQPPVTPVPQPAVPVATPQASDPGKTLAIVGIVLGVIGLSLIGLILSIIAIVKSSKAGFKNTLAIVGIVLNSIFIFIALIFLVITLTAYNGIQSLAKDSLTYSELVALNNGLQSYITYKGSVPSSLADVVSSTPGLKESYLTDSAGKAYTLTWEPSGCSSLQTCSSYTLSGDSLRHKGEKISISYSALTSKTTYVNKPTSSTAK